jgi:hypothetical protein
VNKFFLPLAASMVVSLAAAHPAAAEAPSSCSLATLHGTMAWSATYTDFGVPEAGSGFESYDGHGNLKYSQIFSNGTTTINYTGTGTYTITAGCIASVTYDGIGPAWQYFVAPDGSAYFWTNNQNIGRVASGKVERISEALLVK